MIFDKNGLPRDSGATDFMDSARLAGLIKLVGLPPMYLSMTGAADVTLYQKDGICYRYPFVDSNNPASDNPNNVTRDQMLCLTAGLWASGRQDIALKIYQKIKQRGFRAQNTEADVVGSKKPWYNGADIMLPADINHFRLCAGLKPTVLGLLFLCLDILFFNHSTKLKEPNQLIAKCMVAGPKYVKMLSRARISVCLKDYWLGWRMEPAFCNQILEKFNTVQQTEK